MPLDTTSDTQKLQLYHVRGSIYVLSGAGANITLSIGDDGILMVDTGRSGRTDEVLAAVRDFISYLKFGGEVSGWGQSEINDGRRLAAEIRV